MRKLIYIYLWNYVNVNLIRLKKKSRLEEAENNYTDVLLTDGINGLNWNNDKKAELIKLSRKNRWNLKGAFE